MRYRLRKAILIMSLTWIIGLIGCTTESEIQNIVLTEDVLYLSGERVRITGRVFEINGTVDDHGFYISKDPDFSSPIVISLGAKENGLGRFIGEYELLEINTVYHFRSYANVGGIEITGQSKEFTTLKSRIDSFSPETGVHGTIVTIKGTNFTQDTRVFVGVTEVDVTSTSDETTIQIQIPSIGDVSSVAISVNVQDTTMVFADNFQYHFGHWEMESIFPDNLQLYECMFFIDGDQFIFGMGADERVQLNLNVWSYDLISQTWSDLNFPGSEGGSRFPFTSNGYWGAGAEIVRPAGLNIHTPYFWHYSFGAFQLKPFLTFRIYKSIGLHLNGDLYVFGGEFFDHAPNRTIHLFTTGTDSWSTIAEAPFNLSSDYPYFVHNNEAYFLLPNNDVWKFSPLTGDWNQVGTHPDIVMAGGAAVNINGKVYMGMFTDNLKIFEWDIAANIWAEKINLPGNVRDSNTGFFAYNNKAYFFRSKFNGGQFETDPHMELWSLNPSQLK